MLCWDCLYLHMQRIPLFRELHSADSAINHPQILLPCNRRPQPDVLPRRECRCESSCSQNSSKSVLSLRKKISLKMTSASVHLEIKSCSVLRDSTFDALWTLYSMLFSCYQQHYQANVLYVATFFFTRYMDYQAYSWGGGGGGVYSALSPPSIPRRGALR